MLIIAILTLITLPKNGYSMRVSCLFSREFALKTYLDYNSSDIIEFNSFKNTFISYQQFSKNCVNTLLAKTDSKFKMFQDNLKTRL